MRGRKIEEIEGSSRGIYIRNTADITPKWKNMCSIADIPELCEIHCNKQNIKEILMKKVILILLCFGFCSSIYAEHNVKTIRGVEFEPRTPVMVADFLSIDIPKNWDKETLSFKDNAKNISYIFSKRNPEFAPSIMIFFEDDDGSNYYKIKSKYYNRIYGDKVTDVKEQIEIAKYMDKSADKKTVLYGSNFISGTAFLCLLHYGQEKKTVVVSYNLVFVNKFSTEDWNYITTNSLYILTSIHKK